VFRRLLSSTPAYDAFHFSQLRGDGPVGRFMDRAAVKVMFPHLVEHVDRTRPDVVISVFATGASAAVGLKTRFAGLVTVVFITDSFAHRIWVHEGTDLFLVTSGLAAASVRRYWPDAAVRIVQAPVRSSFYAAPSPAQARAGLGIPLGEPCVLLMSGAWGMGPLDQIARALARSGYWVLAVAGANERLGRQLAEVAGAEPKVRAFGFTDRIPELMAACNVVVTGSGDTCREARLMGCGLVLLDVVPGHGRENVMHELELGDAAVCSPTANSVVGTVRRFLAERRVDLSGSTANRATPVLTSASQAGWDAEFVDALRTAGLELPRSGSAGNGTVGNGTVGNGTGGFPRPEA
jgi:UDP-N-acetylglucosamine:LPS N-acetylglucosamine transferase